MIKICPRCHEQVISNNTNSDIIHTCNSQNDALDEEDVSILTNVSNANLIKDNELITDRGNRDATHFQRQHYEFIDMR